MADESNQGRSAVMIYQLPTPWPTSMPTLIGKFGVGGKIIAITASPDARLEADIMSNGVISTNSRSCRLIDAGGARGRLILSLTVGEDSSVNWMINGRQAGETDPDILMEAGQAQASQGGPAKDEESMKKAMTDRAKYLARCDERYGRLDRERMWRELRDQTDRLPILCERAIADGWADTAALAVALRKLLAPGRGNYLLYLCAADVEEALPVWGRPPPDPKLWSPRNHFQQGPSGLWLSFECFFLHPEGFLTHCVDLENWMESESGWIYDKPTSALELLRLVADKSGAHTDLTDIERIETLEGVEFFGSEAITRILVPLAHRVRDIGANLLRRSPFDN